jgi:hypothetical protein
VRQGRGRVVASGRHRNRRQALEQVLHDDTTSTGPQILAAAADYFRSVFHRVDAATALRVSRELINLTDREAGHPHDGTAHS